MGEFLVAPLVILIIAAVVWAFFFAGKTAQGRRDEETLPDEPYARRQEEIHRLRVEHDETRAPR